MIPTRIPSYFQAKWGQNASGVRGQKYSKPGAWCNMFYSVLYIPQIIWLPY